MINKMKQNKTKQNKQINKQTTTTPQTPTDDELENEQE